MSRRTSTRGRLPLPTPKPVDPELLPITLHRIARDGVTLLIDPPIAFIPLELQWDCARTTDYAWYWGDQEITYGHSRADLIDSAEREILDIWRGDWDAIEQLRPIRDAIRYRLKMEGE